MRGVDGSGSREAAVAGSYERGTESSGSIRAGEFIDQLDYCKLLKKSSVPWN
jgi:hypothetical protein